MIFLQVIFPGQALISLADPPAGSDAGERGVPPRTSIAGSSIPGWVFPARAGQQHSLSPAKTKRKFSLHKSPNFVDFVVVSKKNNKRRTSQEN